MENIMDTFTDLLSGDNLSKLSSALGTDPMTAGKGIAAALPALMGAVSQQAAQPGGATMLLDLLKSPTSQAAGISDGSILSNIGSLLTNPTLAGGAGLLQSLLGGSAGTVEQKVSQASGLGGSTVMSLLTTLAPLVLGFLGKQSTAAGGFNAASLTQFLGDQQGLLRAASPSLLGWLENIDANDDGSIVDDLGRLWNRFTGKS